jgi:hypothetical protein
MQLQAAQREGTPLPATIARTIDVAIDLARTHLVESAAFRGGAASERGRRRRTSRTRSKRVAEVARMTSERRNRRPARRSYPRFADGIERRGDRHCAGGASPHAVRHARAGRITIRASTVRSISTAAVDCRRWPGNSARERSSGGFGMTSMQERARPASAPR